YRLIARSAVDAGRGLLQPSFNGAACDEAVEGAADLAGGEAIAVALEPSTHWQSGGIELAAPCAVVPARAAHTHGVQPASATRARSVRRTHGVSFTRCSAHDHPTPARPAAPGR